MEVKETLGRGSTSSVKKVIYNGRTCALKMLHRDQWNTQCIQREVRIHKSLSHKHIVRAITDYPMGFPISDAHALVLEYGRHSLRSIIVPDVGIEASVAHLLFVQLLSAVKYLHGRHICHRDIKPENMLISVGGNLLLSDFGHATLFFYKEKRRLRSIAGSYEYMAPEVLREDYDGECCDIWSSGVTLFNMLTGRMPWARADSSDRSYARYRRENKHSYGIFSSLRPKSLSLIEGMLQPEPVRHTLQQIESHEWPSQSNRLLDATTGECTDPSFLSGAVECICDLHYTQPEELHRCHFLPQASMPVHKTELPSVYNIYTRRTPADVLRAIKGLLLSMTVPWDAVADAIAFSTVDTKRNRLLGEIIVKRIETRSRVTIRRTNGDPLEFQKFISCVFSGFPRSASD